jgi:hypothetical protein
MNIQFIPNHNKDGTVIPKKDLKTNPKTLSMIEKILVRAECVRCPWLLAEM